jgi:hypothetical protein
MYALFYPYNNKKQDSFLTAFFSLSFNAAKAALAILPIPSGANKNLILFGNRFKTSKPMS